MDERQKGTNKDVKDMLKVRKPVPGESETAETPVDESTKDQPAVTTEKSESEKVTPVIEITPKVVEEDKKSTDVKEVEVEKPT